MMLFLVSTPQIVSLEIAAKILIGEDHVEDLDKSKFKSKWHDCRGLLYLPLNDEISVISWFPNTFAIYTGHF